MVKEDNIHKTSIVLKSDSTGKISDSAESEEKTELKHIRSVSLSALKIITMFSISRDDISETFFSEYSNFSTIYEKLKNVKISDGRICSSEEEFLKNPFDCWMKIVLVIFSSLYSFEDHGNIECDVITSTSTDDKNGPKTFSGVGTYLSTVLRLDSFDWSYHKVDLFIPSESGGRMIFIVDNEPSMYSII